MINLNNPSDVYYVCVEDGRVISMSTHQPNTPDSVTVRTITADEWNSINEEETHWFNPGNLAVELLPDAVTNQKAVDENNRTQLSFLENTDWKVMRHIREKALGQPTTLSEDDYIALENERAVAAAAIDRS